MVYMAAHLVEIVMNIALYGPETARALSTTATGHDLEESIFHKIVTLRDFNDSDKYL